MNLRRAVIIPWLAAFAVLAFFASCRNGSSSATVGNSGDTLHGDTLRGDTLRGDTIAMRYARHITMVRYGDRLLVELLDPWHPGRVLRRYWFGRQGIQLPLSRCVVFNTAHASLLGMLGATDRIAGVADRKYMQLPSVQQRVEKGLVADCGDSMSPDVELMAGLQPDAVWLSPFENSGGYGRLEQLGIPIIECADYMETSPLGRAEWMRFYGLLVGRQAEADSLFSVVEHAYLSLRDSIARLARGEARRPSMLTERLTGSTWYVAGGRSTVGRLIADAGGRYPWAADDHSGSLPLSLEAVLDVAADADVWAFNDSHRPPLTYARLRAEHAGYAQIGAFRRQNVYFVNSMQVPYFEEVAFRPDWLLRDYAIMLHPQWALGRLRYFVKLSPSP